MGAGVGAAGCDGIGIVPWSICEWSIGLASVAGGVGTAVAAGFLAGAGLAAAVFFAGDFLAAGFFLATGFCDAGIVMPGICWCCAAAGAETLANASALAAANKANFTIFLQSEAPPESGAADV